MMKKKNNALLIGLILILVLAIGLSYGYYLLSKVQENSNVVGSKCFNLELASEENNINLNNMYPISDEEGKSLTPYTFTLKNTCDMTASYTLSMEMLEGTTLNSKYVDVMVNNGEIKLLTSYDEASTVLTGSTESRILDKGLLASNSSKDYSIRFWMDKDVEDTASMNKAFQSKIVVDSTPINYDGQIVYDFDYTGGEQTFIVPVSGTYKLETWGAQGGYRDIDIINIKEEVNGGLGGYSTGLIEFNKNAKIYLNIGGQGGSGNEINSENLFGGNGGYNGGGQGGLGNQGYASSNGGGGATHIAYTSGILSDLENFKSDILIVAGGGGGYSSACVALGGSGGGFISNKGSNDYKTSVNTNFTYANNASQNYGYAFGKGADGYNGKGGICGCEGTAGGGGGYYGGYSYEVVKEFESNADVSGAGGSGYIGNYQLTNKVMYCYNCEESSEESTKTISTTCNEETPTSYCAKKGNGYARITLVSIDE